MLNSILNPVDWEHIHTAEDGAPVLTNSPELVGGTIWTDFELEEQGADIPYSSEWELCFEKDKPYLAQGEVASYWFFDKPEYNTYHEMMVNGTEKALDWHFFKKHAKLPQESDKLHATIYDGDAVIPETWDAELMLLYPDEEWADAHYYTDLASGIDCWLCPYLLALFKTAPTTIYIKFN